VVTLYQIDKMLKIVKIPCHVGYKREGRGDKMKKQTCVRCENKITEDINDTPGGGSMICPFCRDCYRKLIGDDAVEYILEWCLEGYNE
jgi:hypothetical protein